MHVVAHASREPNAWFKNSTTSNGPNRSPTITGHPPTQSTENVVVEIFWLPLASSILTVDSGLIKVNVLPYVTFCDVSPPF